MDSTYSFGYWLRRRRKALDLTQEELARRTGCVATTIKKIEADARRPSKQLAEILADVLTIPPEERVTFLQAARGERGVDELALGTAARDLPVVPARPTPPLPTGTVTFLFTDIEGSTQLWEQHPAAMRMALARHDTILRRALEAHAGMVFKTVGDAFHAAFATAADALSAALAAQRVLAAEAWGETGSLRVRMALHTGTAEDRDGDYFGQTLTVRLGCLPPATAVRCCTRWQQRNWCASTCRPRLSYVTSACIGSKTSVCLNRSFSSSPPDCPPSFRHCIRSTRAAPICLSRSQP
jgi:transcriptional regulator with XRE-family HTH domain